MKSIIKFLFLSTVLLITGCNNDRMDKLYSPDNQTLIQVVQKDGKIYYTVAKNNETILADSRPGFQLKENELGDGLQIISIQHSSFNEAWQQVWGEEIDVVNQYNQMKIKVVQPSSGIQFFVVFRAFTDGFGFRYEFPEQEGLTEFTIMDELTEFNLAGNHQAWSIPWDTEFYEGLYTQKPINKLDTVCTPLTIETQSGKYFTIHEANLTDYAAMNLYPVDGNTKLKVYLTPWSTGGKVFTTVPMVTPWRTMIIADSPGDLLLSRIMLNLNEPTKIQDTSWIKPGRYIGIWWGMHMKKYTSGKLDQNMALLYKILKDIWTSQQNMVFQEFW